jgi:hypothetical protein
MALVYPVRELGPVCDYIAPTSSADGPIQTVDILSRPSIDLTNLTNLVLTNISNLASITYDTGETESDVQEDQQDPNVPDQPNIQLTAPTELLLFTGPNSGGLGGGSGVPGFGPVCDRTPTGIETPASTRSDNLSQPNIVFSLPPDFQATSNVRIDNRTRPNLCRSVRPSNIISSGDLGPVCDVSFSNDGTLGGFYECPDGGEGGLLDTPPTPPVETFTPDGGDFEFPPEFPFKLPKIKCFTNAAGATTCYPELPNFPDVDDINWPSYDPDTFSRRNIDRDRLRKRDTTFTFSLYCSIRESFDSWGVYIYELPATCTSFIASLWGAGGGAGGSDRGDTAGGRSANNSGGSGDYLRMNVQVDPSVQNLLTIVIGQGGRHGVNHTNQPVKTRPAFNRGGRGGYPGRSGLSGGGGGGGGATDLYLNGRLIASVGGGGGGGGQGCLAFNPSTPGKPYGNWNQYSWDANNPIANSNALSISKYPSILSLPLQIVELNPRWSPFMAEYVVWPSFGQDPAEGIIFEGRINLNFDVSGTYTFKMAADNGVAVYISPYTEEEPGEFIVDPFDEVFNGGTLGVPNWNGFGDNVPTPPSTIDDFTLVGWTTNFIADPPDQSTYNISTSGRYVIKIVFFNEAREGAASWDNNPGGIALQILRPNGSTLWSTRTFYGEEGHSITDSGDGPGSGAGGGNEGVSGLTSVELGYSGGGCSDRDATCQGGSGGKSWVLDHPSVELLNFIHSENGNIEGWNKPGVIDESGRKSFGGAGGGQPVGYSIVFNGTEYPLTNSRGSFIPANIPGFGQGIWDDSMDGVSFTTNWAWGTPIQESDGINSIPNITRANPSDPRYLQLPFRIRPTKQGGSWTTELRITHRPVHGRGTSWRVNDLLTARFPHAYTDGTVPYLDDDLPTGWARGRYLIGSLIYGADTPVIGDSYIEFQIKITEITNNEPQDGATGAAVIVASYTQIRED